MTNSQDTLDLSGLEYYSLRDYGRMFLRRKWFIIVATLTLAVTTAVVAYFLPNSYKSTTVIIVDPQKIPDYYVNSTVTASVVDRLATLRQQILSATRLGQIINEMGLYQDLRTKKSQEEIVEYMQKNISVDLTVAAHPEKGLGAFSISYVNPNPVVAAQVTNKLASLFIENNIKTRELSVQGTADFLTKELEDAQKELKEKEDRITTLKTRFLGELPESESMQVQAVSSLQLELQNERDAIGQAQQQKIYLQSLLENNPAVVNLDREESPEVSGMKAEESQLQGQVDELRKRYAPSFPDVVKMNIQIQDLQKRIEETKKAYAANRPNAAPAAPKRRNPVLESQIAKLEDDIQKYRQREQEIEKEIAGHQAQLERIPLFQQQMSPVMRDFEVAQDHYRHLLDRKFSADMAADLEVRQKGERFEVLDPAQVPYRPNSPNRPLINLSGLAGGLIVGLAGALVLEILDPSVKTEREILGELGAPIFCEIPWLPTKMEKRWQLLRTLFACVGSAVLATTYSILVALTWR